ncbi:uncharacterized protein LOC120218194 [Hibiscus syriacus]|uniref:uncharacterized protein LOC120218194 n=1 Tax=Hibiscus syriacus TaxID=106335 RepID=UPI001921236B|nr:uncharacterized protein LOC120218194 [Hibiscus syriacus]
MKEGKSVGIKFDAGRKQLLTWALVKVDLKLKVCRGSLLKKTLIREAKSFEAAKLILELPKPITRYSRLPLLRNFAHKNYLNVSRFTLFRMVKLCSKGKQLRNTNRSQGRASSFLFFSSNLFLYLIVRNLLFLVLNSAFSFIYLFVLMDNDSPDKSLGVIVEECKNKWKTELCWG